MQNYGKSAFLVPRQYLKRKPENVENKAVNDHGLTQNPNIVPNDMKNDGSIEQTRLIRAVFFTYTFLSLQFAFLAMTALVIAIFFRFFMADLWKKRRAFNFDG